METNLLNVRPLRDRIYIRPDSEVESSGLVLPGRKTREGTVLAVPDGFADLQPGDRVRYPPLAGIKLKISDEEVLVLSDGQIREKFSK